MGGEINEGRESRDWICNSPIPPDVESVRFFLSERTEELFNNYIVNLENEEMLELNITNATCIDYDVNENSVMSGQNDERFNVGAYGSEINISYKNDSVYSKNDIYEEIAQDRFWYLYRNFRVWSETTSFPSCVCKCLGEGCCCSSGDCLKGACPAFEDCVEKCFEQAEDELESRFDEYVTCSHTFSCCWIENEPCSDDKSPPCTFWETDHCGGCQITDPGILCSKSLNLLGNIENKNYYTIKLEDEKKCTGECKFWDLVRTAIDGSFSCKDKKYFLSTEEKRKLIFSAGVNIKYKGIPPGGDCKKTVDCVEKESGSCDCEEDPPCGDKWCERTCETS